MTDAETTQLPRACDDEPIHIPGAIQPHGVLVSLDMRTFEIAQVSANCVDYFRVASADVIGRPLTALVGDLSEALLAGVRAARGGAGDPRLVEVSGPAFDARIHCHQGVAILEFERHDPKASASDAVLRAALARLQHPARVSELAAIAVEEVRALTGFDRVLLYRFDEEGHGDVLEESRAAGVDSYRGLRFPASDIPRQARAMYVLNWLRLIPDATYAPIRLVPERRPDGGRALDLSFATLRSVSPVHLEYLRNMGVGASMSVSLVHDGALWGLIACHHRSPRHVSFAARAACEVIGRLVSLQITALQEIESRTERDALRGVEATLVDVMRDAPDDAATALVQRGDALLRLMGAGGAAVSTSTGVLTVGATPAPAQIAALVAWLGKQGASGIVHTERLAERHPPAAEYPHVASGLMALTLPAAGGPSYVLWFRPELLRSVTWAGDPTKEVNASEDGTRLHPRHSFESWKQVVRAHAVPWRAAEIDAAEDLRRRAIEADLSKQIARAEHAVLLRDEMVAIVSHDLKNPLQGINMAAALLTRNVAGDPRAEETLAVVKRSVARMSGLIHDLLDLAKIEAGRFDVTPERCAAARLVSEAITSLAPIAEAKAVRLTSISEAAAHVQSDPERVFQVFSNLIGNAIKFTPAGGEVTVDVRVASGEVRFEVRDTGPGIGPSELPHIFDRYWQARRMRSAGAGLGLYIAKGIVEAHGGRIWAESVPSAGATFYFTLPSCGGRDVVA